MEDYKFRDNFTIIPKKDVLKPNEEKKITLRFEAKEEWNLQTKQKDSDIIMSILEGMSLEKYKEVVINVNVNAVLSKYSIFPISSINFGPMLFNS